MSKVSGRIWKAQVAVLIVGEGADEEAFLKHIKIEANCRGKGRFYKIMSANGGSPVKVLEWTVSQTQNVEYDEVYVLLDNDTIVSGGYQLAVESYERKYGLKVLISTDCLEEMLLRVAGRKRSKTKHIKTQFESLLGPLGATVAESYKGNFGIGALLAARANEETMDAILEIFRL